MLTFGSFSAAVALAGALALPALAQTSAVQTTTLSPPPSGAGATGAVTKGPAGTLHTTHGMWRSANLVGATVYNDSGEMIGKIANLLITPQGSVSMAVLSVGGFLGVDAKLVAVPFYALKFEPSVNNGAAPGATPLGPGSAALASTTAKPPAHGWTSRTNYSAVLPNSSKAALTKMVAFTYHQKPGAH